MCILFLQRINFEGIDVKTLLPSESLCQSSKEKKNPKVLFIFLNLKCFRINCSGKSTKLNASEKKRNWKKWGSLPNKYRRIHLIYENGKLSEKRHKHTQK